MDGGGFVGDDEDVWGVEALEAIHDVGGEAYCVSLDVEFEAGVVEFSADAVVVATVDVVDFAPDLVSDLSVGWRGGDHYGFVVGHQPPDDGERGGVGLAGAFGRIDRDPVVSAKGLEDLSLVVSQRNAETLGDEPVGLVSPLGAFARCGGVGHGREGWMVAAPLPWLGPVRAPWVLFLAQLLLESQVGVAMTV